MTKNNRRNTSLIILLSTIITGCGGSSIIKLNAFENGNYKNEDLSHLKCAPYTTIVNIDNNTKYSIAAQPTLNFTDCDIRLPPGNHSVALCYQNNSCSEVGLASASLGVLGAVITAAAQSANTTPCVPEVIKFDTLPGHIYRIKSDIVLTTAECKFSGREPGKAYFSIIDDTKNDLAIEYYNKAKKMSDTAKSRQSDDDWSNAVLSWKMAVEYATAGNLSPDIRLKLEKNYSNALAATCHYSQALEQLEIANKIDEEFDWSRDSTLLALARVNLITNNRDAAQKYYTAVRQSYRSILSDQENTFVDQLLQNESNDAVTISTKLRYMDKNLEYGKYCEVIKG